MFRMTITEIAKAIGAQTPEVGRAVDANAMGVGVVSANAEGADARGPKIENAVGGGATDTDTPGTERATGTDTPRPVGGEVFCRVSTDSRNTKPGDLFFALQGENHDAHDYAAQAVRNGARAVVLAREVCGIPAGLPVLYVADTLKALQDLAGFNVRRSGVPVIGITGSNGKTTTKDMVASVLGVKYKVLKNKGNFNNEIGLPLTLLDLDESHQVAVVEMGMRGLGEIAALCEIAPITGAVITTIGETHLELLGSVDAIAQAKGEILDFVPEKGFAVLNADSPHIEREALRNGGRTLYFSLTKDSDIGLASYRPDGCAASFTLKTGNGNIDINLPATGKHNVSNALAAAGVGICMGLTLEEIKLGFSGLELSPMRVQFHNLANITIINDAYNANPDSTKAALDVLAEAASPGQRTVAVLGDMLELGEREVPGHWEVGEYAAAGGIDILFAYGTLAKHIAGGAVDNGMDLNQVFWFEDKEQMLKVLGANINTGDMVLVKGSRGMRMEEVVEYLTRQQGGKVCRRAWKS